MVMPHDRLLVRRLSVHFGTGTQDCGDSMLVMEDDGEKGAIDLDVAAVVLDEA